MHTNWEFNVSKVNDDDLFAVLPALPKGKWPKYEEYENRRMAADKFADRYTMELNQIIVGKLSQEDRQTYYKLIGLNSDILLYILFKKELVEGINYLSSYRNPGCSPTETDGPFPWFKPVYKFLKSNIPDIWEIGQTLRKDIANDFPI